MTNRQQTALGRQLGRSKTAEPYNDPTGVHLEV